MDALITVSEDVNRFSKSLTQYMKFMFPIRAKEINRRVYRIVKFQKSDVIFATILISGPICSLNWKIEKILRIKHTIQTAKIYENSKSILAEKLATILIVFSSPSTSKSF